MSIKYLRRSV